MKDYIEREAAIAAAFSVTSLGDSAFRDVYDTVNRLRLIPAADVVEVRHGRWITHNSLVNGALLDENEVFVCSACQEQRTRRKYNFCPNCGAKMTEV